MCQWSGSDCVQVEDLRGIMPYVKTQPLFASNWISVQNQRGQTPTSKLKIELQRIWRWEAPDALNAVYQIRKELSVS